MEVQLQQKYIQEIESRGKLADVYKGNSIYLKILKYIYTKRTTEPLPKIENQNLKMNKQAED